MSCNSRRLSNQIKIKISSLNLTPEVSEVVTTNQYNTNVTTSNQENVLAATSPKITIEQTIICDKTRCNQTQTDKPIEKKP